MPRRAARVARRRSSRARRSDEGAGGDAQGAERAEDRAALLEGEADGAVDDEEADGEGQEPEGGEVEVEAVGEPREVGAAFGRAFLERGGDVGERGARERLVGQEDEAGEAALEPQESLRGADVGERDAGGEAGAFDDRGEVALEPGGGGGGGEEQAGGRQEGGGVAERDLGRVGAGRRGEGIEPDEPHAAAFGQKPPSTTGETRQPARRSAT
jgi:hypothetical protein